MHLFILIMTALVTNTNLTVTSPSFNHNGMIPAKYTCDGANVNPALLIGNIPAKAKSLVLIMDDPDAPGTFDHWIMWNIPVKDKKIEENSKPGVQGKNGKNENGYTGPCPPSGLHHYHFKIYALDTKLDLKEGSDKAAVNLAIQGHILAAGELIGTYQK